jgi:hypothetical protein
MPVTSFALLFLAIIASVFALFWAMSTWGALTVLPVLIAAALIARWAMAPLPYDDTNA